MARKGVVGVLLRQGGSLLAEKPGLATTLPAAAGSEQKIRSLP